MTPSPQPPKKGRIDSIDFWRGIVLILILCDHVPGNWIEKATPRNFALSDSAEAFVFLSGVSVALAYFGRAQKADWRGLIERCFGRAFRIYGVHIGLTCAAIAIAAVAYWLCGAPDLIEAQRRSAVFHQPLQTAPGILLLTEQLDYFNILPLYVVLMLWSPAVLAMTRVSPWLALGGSLAIYAAAKAFGLTLPSWPEPDAWFFNPLAWQLVFALGIVARVVFRDRPIPYSPVLFWGAAAALGVSAFGVTEGFWQWPGIRDGLFSHVDLFKGNLGAGRLLHFVALAYVISQISVARVERSAIGRELRRLGRHSLPVFALGSVLSCAGQAAMQIWTSMKFGDPSIIGCICTLFGIIGLILFARYIERHDQAVYDRWNARETQPSSWVRLRSGFGARPRAPVARPGAGGQPRLPDKAGSVRG
jgi:hypothetical protein